MDAEAALFKVLADPTRLRLAVLLAMQGETCVCKLAQALAVPDFKISRHLAVMRAAGMVAARRRGTWMHYRLAAPRTRLEGCFHRFFRSCLGDHPAASADRRRLGKIPCATE